MTATPIQTGRQARLAMLQQGGLRHAPSVALVLLFYATHIIWSAQTGLHFLGLLPVMGAAVLLLLVAMFYALFRTSAQIIEVTLYAACWVLLSTFGSMLTYHAVALSTREPLVDPMLLAWDRALGLHWEEWVSVIQSYPWLSFMLRLSYLSLLPQILLTLFFLSYRQVANRNAELFIATALALYGTTLVWKMVPALGPWVVFDFGASYASDLGYVSDVTAIREQSTRLFAVENLQGIVVFPSFHTVLAFLFAYAHRGLGWITVASLFVNGAMLLSIPSEGGHYFVDMLGGAVVAALAIVAAKLITTVFSAKIAASASQ